MKKGLRFIFLNILGAIVGVCLLLAYVYHKTTGGSLKQDMGWALPPAPYLVATGAPGHVFKADQTRLVSATPPQAAGGGKKRWDVILYEKRIPSYVPVCGIFIYGQQKYSDKTGALEATWYPLSFVSAPHRPVQCFAPPGPVMIATGSPERKWSIKNTDVLAGPEPLGIDSVRNAIGDPELEEIEGKYSKYSGRDVKGPSSFGNFYKWTLMSQTDIYRFKNRTGYLKITYDDRGLSTKIEDGTAKND